MLQEEGRKVLGCKTREPSLYTPESGDYCELKMKRASKSALVMLYRNVRLVEPIL